MAQQALTESVKTRISEELKGLLKTAADARELDESDVVREALREYFTKREGARAKKSSLARSR